MPRQSSERGEATPFTKLGHRHDRASKAANECVQMARAGASWHPPRDGSWMGGSSTAVSIRPVDLPARNGPKRPAVSLRCYLGLVQAAIRAYGQHMRTLPISKVKDKLNELVDAAASTREQVTITKNGSPAAVLIGVDEWESIQESLFWLSQPGIRESMAEAEADVKEGRVYSEEQIRAEFNVPKGER